jgi:hypothetical protein
MAQCCVKELFTYIYICIFMFFRYNRKVQKALLFFDGNIQNTSAEITIQESSEWNTYAIFPFPITGIEYS